VRGKQNRAAGQIFEENIEAACREYRQAGVAEIEKTPEAMKPLGGARQGTIPCLLYQESAAGL
jgi:hypothetical protein